MAPSRAPDPNAAGNVRLPLRRLLGRPVRRRNRPVLARGPRPEDERIHAERLRIDERRQQLAKPILHLAWLAESPVEERLESLLRFRPRQRGRKRVEGVEEAVERWQRDLVNEILRCRDRAPIEGGNAAREHVHEAVQLSVRESPINVSVPCSGLAVKVVRTENDFERATAAEEQWQAFGTTPAGMDSRPHFDLSQDR